MSLENYTCDRCGNNKPDSLKMSIFNTDMCCPECLIKERKHKDYQKAVDVEHNAVKNGDFNFPGIGLPEDLR